MYNEFNQSQLILYFTYHHDLKGQIRVGDVGGGKWNYVDGFDYCHSSKMRLVDMITPPHPFCLSMKMFFYWTTKLAYTKKTMLKFSYNLREGGPSILCILLYIFFYQQTRNYSKFILRVIICKLYTLRNVNYIYSTDYV